MKITFPWFKPLINKNQIGSSFLKILNSNKMTMGKKTSDFEKIISKELGVKYVILTTSGTSALMMATLALGLEKNHKVVSPNLTWVATINPARIIGSSIHLVDCIPESEKVDFIQLINSVKKYRPKIVYLTHLNGQASYDENFYKLKKKLKFKVIEDAAQSIFLKHKKKFVGTIFDIGCYSLSITKPFNMIYGGFCVTNDKKMANKLMAIRNNGVNSEPENAKLEIAKHKGLNLKPSDLHSIVGIKNFKLKKKILRKIILIHKLYEKKINNKKLKFLKIDYKTSIPIYAQVFVKDRKRFCNYCKKMAYKYI